MKQSVGRRIRVRGLVQGVGFRPTVWQIATQLGLVGTVLNDGDGVLIHLSGTSSNIDKFIVRLGAERPPLSRIDAIERDELKVACSYVDFRIIPSKQGKISTAIVPDAATCPHCLEDILDQNNRRSGYSFANCTHCGPRLTITRHLPYDRKNTSMAEFNMCSACQNEYDDPTDRRFHAQPNACPQCGPRLSLVHQNAAANSAQDDSGILAATAKLLIEGKILAIKGLGGFHFACDATNELAVALLRARKHRPSKPLAVMVKCVEMARQYVSLSSLEERALTGTAAPIVLADQSGQDQQPSIAKLADQIAPGIARIGVMLPYTPLHHLLLKLCDRPLVMTSGNLSGEPQVIDNEQALKDLSGVADAFLLHNRTIVNRVDDSVVQVIGDAVTVIRRARGFAPSPLLLPCGFDSCAPILGMGAALKNTFCQLSNGQAVVSHHIGDLDRVSAHDDYSKAMALYGEMRQFQPDGIAVDLHPDYASTKKGIGLAQKLNVELVQVQHHHAHVAAGLAEFGLPIDTKPVLAVVLDGLGLGDDGYLWGGELLLANYTTYKRLGYFEEVGLLGGDKANQEPWRNTYSHIQQAMGWEAFEWDFSGLELASWLQRKPLSVLETMLEKSLNTPLSSSAGRLFDAVAGALDICRASISYEGEAATRLQACAERYLSGADLLSVSTYPTRVQVGVPAVLSFRPMWFALLQDLADKQPVGYIAARFHSTLAHATGEMAIALAKKHQCDHILLSGGVCQNRLLTNALRQRIGESGINVLLPCLYPIGDGGISLGQALIAAARKQQIASVGR
ncbi:carbamoyltransferase HypF [Pseudovibrio sp. POLY-S9]|uniref:carbamoyltransferase HypF n=1 Tax=Pseudovibrio sp. POLY-S9 TaxID=1576596 RepID=UPI00070BBAC6|nr:carbamoyltransferase HypF [Pseudovibrio sp. POLY-S9]